MKNHTMTIEEIEQKIIDNNNLIDSYNKEWTAIHDAGYSTTADYGHWIRSCENEINRLTPILLRLKKIDKLLLL